MSFDPVRNAVEQTRALREQHGVEPTPPWSRPTAPPPDFNQPEFINQTAQDIAEIDQTVEEEVEGLGQRSEAPEEEEDPGWWSEEFDTIGRVRRARISNSERKVLVQMAASMCHTNLRPKGKTQFWKDLVAERTRKSRERGGEAIIHKWESVKTFIRRDMDKRRAQLAAERSGDEIPHSAYYEALDTFIEVWDNLSKRGRTSDVQKAKRSARRNLTRDLHQKYPSDSSEEVSTSAEEGEEVEAESVAEEGSQPQREASTRGSTPRGRGSSRRRRTTRSSTQSSNSSNKRRRFTADLARKLDNLGDATREGATTLATAIQSSASGPHSDTITREQFDQSLNRIQEETNLRLLALEQKQDANFARILAALSSNLGQGGGGVGEVQDERLQEEYG